MFAANLLSILEVATLFTFIGLGWWIAALILFAVVVLTIIIWGPR